MDYNCNGFGAVHDPVHWGAGAAPSEGVEAATAVAVAAPEAADGVDAFGATPAAATEAAAIVSSARPYLTTGAGSEGFNRGRINRGRINATPTSAGIKKEMIHDTWPRIDSLHRLHRSMLFLTGRICISSVGARLIHLSSACTFSIHFAVHFYSIPRRIITTRCLLMC